MGAWASAAEALASLRRFTNDGPTDRPIKDKAVVGPIDGVNTKFMTYDDRVVVGSLVVTVDNVAVTVTLDDPIRGDFTLSAAPVVNSTVKAHYYFQYFLDIDLNESVQLAAGDLVESDDITLVEPGLKSAALSFGKSYAFGKQAIRWAERMSERFLLEEAPLDSNPQHRANLFQQISKDAMTAAIALRTSFYERHGRRGVAAFAITKPHIPVIGPRR